MLTYSIMSFFDESNPYSFIHKLNDDVAANYSHLMILIFNYYVRASLPTQTSSCELYNEPFIQTKHSTNLR